MLCTRPFQQFLDKYPLLWTKTANHVSSPYIITCVRKVNTAIMVQLGQNQRHGTGGNIRLHKASKVTAYWKRHRVTCLLKTNLDRTSQNTNLKRYSTRIKALWCPFLIGTQGLPFQAHVGRPKSLNLCLHNSLASGQILRSTDSKLNRHCHYYILILLKYCSSFNRRWDVCKWGTHRVPSRPPPPVLEGFILCLKVKLFAWLTVSCRYSYSNYYVTAERGTGSWMPHNADRLGCTQTSFSLSQAAVCCLVG